MGRSHIGLAGPQHMAAGPSSLYLSLAPHSFTVTKKSLPLSPPGKSCLHTRVPWFLAFCSDSLLKNSFFPIKFRKIAPSHYRWAGYPRTTGALILVLPPGLPKREEVFWAKK